MKYHTGQHIDIIPHQVTHYVTTGLTRVNLLML
jgi:hypothetical protein